MCIVENFKTFCSVIVEKLNLIRLFNLYLIAVFNYEIAFVTFYLFYFKTFWFYSNLDLCSYGKYTVYVYLTELITTNTTNYKLHLITLCNAIQLKWDKKKYEKSYNL